MSKAHLIIQREKVLKKNVDLLLGFIVIPLSITYHIIKAFIIISIKLYKVYKVNYQR